MKKSLLLCLLAGLCLAASSPDGHAGVTFPITNHEVCVAPGFNHVPVEISYTPDAGFDESTLSVSADVSWVTPTVDSANNRIRLTFDTDELTGSYTGTITVNDGAATRELFITAKVTPLDIFRLVDDPIRSRTYGIHRNGIYSGAIVAFDPITETPISCITVGRSPTDFVINDDATELLVINCVSKTIDIIDLTTFTLKETLVLTTYFGWSDDGDTSANIELGPGDIIYYLDGSWGPVLHVLDRSSNTILQRIIFNGTTPTNNNGFQDIAVTSDKTRMVAMPQYGWSAGAHYSIIAHYNINTNGTVTYLKDTSVNNFPREPFEAPALMREDDQVAILKNLAVNPADTDDIKRSFPSTIWSMSPNGAIVATWNKLYEYSTGRELLTIPGDNDFPSNYIYSFAQAFTSDYTRFVYFDNGDKTLKVINLVEALGLEVLGRELSPGHKSVVTSPSKLIWSPIAGMDQYDIYLGTNEDDVANADTASSLYQGRITGSSFDLSQSLTNGSTYFWRIDPVTPVGPETGPVFSFFVSEISLSQSAIEIESVTGHSDIVIPIEVDSATPGVAYSAAADQSWVSFDPATGTTPAPLHVTLDATDLEPGYHEASVAITTPAGAITVPVSLWLNPLNLTHLKSARDSHQVYAISENAGETLLKAYLLEINSETEKIERVLPVGDWVTDLAIHYSDDKLYVPNWKSGNLLEINRTTFAHLATFAFNPFGGTGYGEGDAYRVSAGATGRLVVEEQDQWIDISLYDTINQKTLSQAFVREGGGVFGPNGRYYYHGENNSSGASIQKFDTMGDALTQLKEIRPPEISSYYGQRTVILSENGQRIFWAGVVLDGNLNSEWNITQIVYSTSPTGRYAFCENDIIDVDLRRKVLQMPTATRVSAYNSTTDKLILQVGEKIGFYPFTSPYTMPAPVLSLEPVQNNAYIRLVWTDESLETEFQVQHRPTGGAEDWITTTTTGANVTSWNVTNLTEGQEYEFRVRAAGSESSSTWSNIITAAIPTTPPPAPSLYVPTAAAESVSLSWSSSSSATGYLVERSPDGEEPWTLLATLPQTLLNYTDDTVTDNSTWYYRIKAVKGSTTSLPSNVRMVTTPELTPPDAPRNLMVRVASATQLNLSWSNVGDEDGYKLERRVGTGNWALLSELPQFLGNQGTVGFLDTTVTKGVLYTYRVTAFNQIGVSPYSLEASATPATLSTVLADDFDPALDSTLWDAVYGASVINAGQGFGGSNVLWFGGSGERSATTYKVLLSPEAVISFKLRAGNTAEDGNFYWENSEANESVSLQVSMDGGYWNTIQTFNTTYPNLSDWQSFEVTIPSHLAGSMMQLRWRQTGQDGERQDTWALDDVVVKTVLPEPEVPLFLMASPNSSSEISLLWFAGAHAQQYIVERRTVTSQWVKVAHVPAGYRETVVFRDSGLLPSTFYIYRVKARNDTMDSAWSPTTLAKTFDAYIGWLLENYGTNEEDIILSNDGAGLHPLLRFAFNMSPTDQPQHLNNQSASGLPFNHVDNDNHLCITYFRYRHAAAAGIAYLPEVSENFTNWQVIDNEIAVETVDANWERVTIRNPDPLPATGVQMGRVRIIEQ